MAYSAMMTSHAKNGMYDYSLFQKVTKAALLGAVACTASMVASAPASAQAAADAYDPTEIIVTARKRQESILNVPVIETAVSQQQLERLQTNNIKDLVTRVPGLVAGTATASSGLQISIRGIGNTVLDPAVDQAVALFADGQQFSQGMAYAAAMFDIGQVEVLKGPQALFYGKGSPGGVISLRTADPTDKFEVIGRAGYEFEARQRRGELILSGPVSDTLKLRLSALGERQDGFYKNNVAAAVFGGATPKYSRIGNSWDVVLRGTALWNPSEKFNARLKVTGYRTRVYQGGAGQLKSCPEGTAGLSGIPFEVGDNCKIDRNMPVVDLNPAVFFGVQFGGVPQQRTGLRFGTLEMNFLPVEDITITSVSGYYRQQTDSMINGSSTVSAGPTLVVQNQFYRTEKTQEMRVNTDFSSPLNFTLGAFAQDASFMASQDLPANSLIFSATALPTPGRKLAKGKAYVDIASYSFFGQARYQLTPEFELAGGTRWTNETRNIHQYNQISGSDIFVPLARPQINSQRWSPEVTLTFKPSNNVTIFAAAKQGWKSGSFNAGAVPAPNTDNSYGDERARGAEAGFKSRLLDRRLALDVAVYHYDYSNLQIGVNETGANGVPVARTVNAGKARVYGVDFSTAYRPEAIEGLTLNFNGEWNHGKFLRLNNVPCWYGQTIAEGCNQIFSPAPPLGTNQFTAQDLSGSDLPRGPRWQLNFGFDYEMPLSNGMTITLNNSNGYTSRYVTFPGNRADFYQKGFLKADASIGLRGKDNRWELALVGKNITNKYTASNCSAYDAVNGSLLGPTTFTGTAARGPAGVGEVGCRPDPGRELWVRLTIRPFG